MRVCATLPGHAGGGAGGGANSNTSPGPDCGHVAIKFQDQIAFARTDGELDVFTTQDGSSLDDLCFCSHDELIEQQRSNSATSECCDDPGCGGQLIREGCCDEPGAHVHAHLRSECEQGLRGAALARNRVTLKKLASQESELLVPPEAAPTTGPTQIQHGNCDHKDGPGCGGQMIRHGDHFDFLVEKEDGTKELHHPYKDSRGVQRCVVHGILRPEDIAGGAWKNIFTFEPVKQIVQVMTQGFSPSRETRTTLYVEGICCPSEIPLIEKMLKPLPGIIKVAVNVPNRTTTVDHDVSQTNASDLVLALASLGARIHSANESNDATWPKWNVLASGLFFALSLISIAGHVEEEDGVPPEEPPCDWCDHLKWAAIAGIVLGWPPILKKAWGALKNKVLDITC